MGVQNTTVKILQTPQVLMPVWFHQLTLILEILSLLPSYLWKAFKGLEEIPASLPVSNLNATINQQKNIE